MFFQVGHAFHQGPKTAEMNLLVTTCETVNESMIQLVVQVNMILHPRRIASERYSLDHHCPLEWWLDRQYKLVAVPCNGKVTTAGIKGSCHRLSGGSIQKTTNRWRIV